MSFSQIDLSNKTKYEKKKKIFSWNIFNAKMNYIFSHIKMSDEKKKNFLEHLRIDKFSSMLSNNCQDTDD